jgi:hypothetical protein
MYDVLQDEKKEYAADVNFSAQAKKRLLHRKKMYSYYRLAITAFGFPVGLPV